MSKIGKEEEEVKKGQKFLKKRIEYQMAEIPCIHCSYFVKKTLPVQDPQNRKKLLVLGSIVLFLFLLCICAVFIYVIYLFHTPWILFPESVIQQPQKKQMEQQKTDLRHPHWIFLPSYFAKNKRKKQLREGLVTEKNKKPSPSTTGHTHNNNNNNNNRLRNVTINNLSLNQGFSWTTFNGTTEKEILSPFLCPRDTVTARSTSTSSLSKKISKPVVKKKKNKSKKKGFVEEIRSPSVLNDQCLLQLIGKYLTNQKMEFTLDLFHSFITDYKHYINNETSFEVEEKRMTALIKQAIEPWSLWNKTRLLTAVTKYKKQITSWLQT